MHKSGGGMGWADCKLFCQAGSNPSPAPSQGRHGECYASNVGPGLSTQNKIYADTFTTIVTIKYEGSVSCRFGMNWYQL